MKKIVLGLLLITGFIAKAQVYNNEWIDYSKTYYKFKVGVTGLYRIPQSVLATSGLSSTPAEYFQLWRNGKQIPIYTSIPSGAFSSSDYIEFWGEQNDGKPDRELYRDPNWQLNNKWSLETDTASYFLTVDPNVSNNLRLVNAPNNVAGTSLPAESYFMYTTGKYFKDRINTGWAVNVGEYLYSASYDKGEGWSSNDIITTYNSNLPNYGKNVFVFKNLNAYTGIAPSAKFKIAVSGNLINLRRYLAKINSDSVVGNNVDYFNYSVDSASFSINSLNSVSDTVTVFNYSICRNDTTCPSIDRMVVHQYELTYPHNFDFNGSSNFVFSLPSNASGNYLQISNFSYGSTPPVLYDLTNGKRYTADLSSAPLLQFVLDPSSTSRTLALVSEAVGNVNTVSSMQTRNFINYTDASNQGDYLIISNSILFAGANGTNPVDDYRQYRSSQQGGGYNAKIFLADQIIDQFGFGIKQNPAAIRDFILYARDHFITTPKHVFIIGHGVNYWHQRLYESASYIDQLDLVPTYGYPASDILLAADKGSSQPTVSIGRLSAINASEVSTYLKKVKEYEQAQALQSPLVSDKAWMKNVVHIVGASDDNLESILSSYMNSFTSIIADTLYGANVTTFEKSSTSSIEQINSNKLTSLFNEGISLITYFGHSSSSTLAFNLDAPQNYNNYGKYPMFAALGCNAGNFFNYDPNRLQIQSSLSELYVFAPDRGTIGFIASTHFGIPYYLNVWGDNIYKNISKKSYGKTMGEIIKSTGFDMFTLTSQEDFMARCTIEENELHSDPAIRLNVQPKPDYAIEDSMVKITPSFVSVADQSFHVDASIINLGKAPDSNVVVEIKHQLPDQSIVLVRRDTIPPIKFQSGLSVDVPINPVTDKGLNKIIVTIDPDNSIDELFENNNTVSKDITIYEDEARPAYPANFAIINKPIDTLIASTANPFSITKQYQVELDTTELFNSPFKIAKTITISGGTIEFVPGISFTDNTVYYWRISPVSPNGSFVWNTASFIYLANSEVGFNQSHLFQHLKSGTQQLYIDSLSRNWIFKDRVNNIFLRNGIYPTTSGQGSYYTGTINDQEGYIGAGCNYDELIFNVVDPETFMPWKNDSSLLYNSNSFFCGAGRTYNFLYSLNTSQWRKKVMDFIDTIPDGFIVVLRNNANPNMSGNTYSSVWKTDEAIYGPGNSLYQRLLDQGFTNIDSFNRPRSFIFIFKKNHKNDFTPVQKMSSGIYDGITADVNFISTATAGLITSPAFGPAKSWKQLLWQGNTIDINPGDSASVDVIGVKTTGEEHTLYTKISPTQNFDISSINATTYPYVKLRMYNQDSINLTPYQLNYWRITYSPVPEGAISPNKYFSMKDTVDVAEPLEFKVAFKNISKTDFADSIKINAVITDKNNVAHVLPSWKGKPLIAGDTLYVRNVIDTRHLTGNNMMYVEVNPNNDQPEQFHFNNFFYKNFFVRPDTLNPLLDVTFDNVHILNNDLVSSKPSIQINLKDEAKWFLIDDPSKLKIQIRQLSSGIIKDYAFGTDTLQFIPAQQAPTTNNTAKAEFKPYFGEDGFYELIVTGKDMSDNQAGTMQYRVTFEVVNKAMISNMMNYPNPFTTSTAFVFTLTGSEIPQNIRIQILTVTGKIVREITKDELGPLHIGRNITEFKWDGTDQYGQKVANGIYLYRVITNLNGKSLDKYTPQDGNTDKYFNKGYGKMYFMR